MAENTVKIRYEGGQPATVGHMAWYPGETWNVDPKIMAQLQADGVPICLLEPPPDDLVAEPDQAPELPQPKRKRKETTL
jgi:hypothetical protein